MCARLLVPLFLFLACPLARAGSVLVIDDFTDPARIEFPDGPEEAVTQGVGDLNAERTLYMWRSGGDHFTTFATAGIDAGRYLVDMDDPGEVTIVGLRYNFPTADFSQYEAIGIEISQWPPPSVEPLVPSKPSLMVVAVEDTPQERYLVRRLTRGIQPGVIELPLDTFTSRGGNPFDGNWHVIKELHISSGSHEVWGPWNITLDRITLGPAVPEPTTTTCVLTGCVSWLFFSCHLRRTRTFSSSTVDP